MRVPQLGEVLYTKLVTTPGALAWCGYCDTQFVGTHICVRQALDNAKASISEQEGRKILGIPKEEDDFGMIWRRVAAIVGALELAVHIGLGGWLLYERRQATAAEADYVRTWSKKFDHEKDKAMAGVWSASGTIMSGTSGTFQTDEVEMPSSVAGTVSLRLYDGQYLRVGDKTYVCVAGELKEVR